LDAKGVQVTVRCGEVTLLGHVANVETKRRLESIVESCQGVRGVTNLLEIQVVSEARPKSGGTGSGLALETINER
jgi:hypothetical protein